MKKTLLSMLCLLLSTMAFAATWDKPADGTYSDRYVVYIQLNANGSQVKDGAEIAAFIGSECRGYVDMVDMVSNTGFYPMEVWGNETDNGKSISFKAMYRGIAYTFTKKLNYAHQSTNTPIPFVLNMDVITGLSLTNPIDINQKVGTTYDLRNDVTYTYSTPDGAPYTALGQSSVDATMTTIGVKWFTYSSNFTVTPAGILTVGHECTMDAIMATLTRNGYDTDVKAETKVNITEPHVSVTGITLSSTKIECWTGTNVQPLVAALATVLPADASNKSLTIQPASGSAAGFSVSDATVAITAVKAGTWTLVVSSVDNPAVKKNVTVEVKQHVTGLSCPQSEITVDLNEDVFQTIRDMVTVLPADAYNKAITLTPLRGGILNATGIAIAEGEEEIRVAANDGANVSPIIIKVHVESSVNFEVPSWHTVSVLTPDTLRLENFTGNGFDPTLVTITLDDDIATFDRHDTGLAFTVHGKKFGTANYTVKYNGRTRGTGTLEVIAELKLKAGWNWVSNYWGETYPLMTPDGPADYAFFEGSKKITEIRSQNELLYNDPTYGMFGQLNALVPNTMYKMNVSADRRINVYLSGSVDIPTQEISRKGYTWFAYNIIGDHTFDYINTNNLLNGKSGDLIIGKNGFAEHDGTRWVASADFLLETGQGYIYYKNDALVRTLNFGASSVAEPHNIKRHIAANGTPSIWQYNPNAYADNMCIVARLTTPVDAQAVTIGAFVDGECRGMGSVVDGDIMFINVAGQAGEQVTFRTYNATTGEYAEVNEALNYTQKVGSLQAPVLLTTEGDATAINGINAEQGNDAPAYSISGMRVHGAAKGIVIKNGKKYIVK